MGCHTERRRVWLSIDRNYYHRIAGWSSLVARLAHNQKVVRSNRTPATNLTTGESVV